MQGVATIIRIDNNMEVIIPERTNISIEDIEEDSRLLNIKYDTIRAERRSKNRQNRGIRRFSKMLASLFV